MSDIFSEEMSVFIRIYQLFSLFPISLNPITNILLKIYSVFNILFVIGIFFSAFFVFPVLEDSNSLSLLVGGLMFIGLLVTHVINLMQAFTSRHDQMMIYKKFDEIDHLLQNELLVNINYKRLRQRLLAKYLLITFFVVAIQTTTIASSVVYNLYFRYFTHLILTIFIVRIRCIQNMFYVDLIKEKLNLVNNKLDDTIRRNREKMAFAIYTNKLQRFDQRIEKRSSLYDQLMALKQVYGKIWDISNLINDCFGWSLLAIVTQYFIEFTSNGYWLFLALENLLDRSIAIQSLCSIFPIVIILTTMAYSCHRCSENSQQTGVLIHKIERDINNDLQNALIREFSLQIIHEPIEISANGFFNINFTLLGSMSAATVTYLVILIQFQLSEIKKSGNVEN